MTVADIDTFEIVSTVNLNNIQAFDIVQESNIINRESAFLLVCTVEDLVVTGMIKRSFE